MLKLEELMEENDQYFQVFDLGQMKFLFTSKKILRDDRRYSLKRLIPDIIHSLYTPMMKRGLGRPGRGYYKMEKEIFKAQKGSAIDIIQPSDPQCCRCQL